MTAEPAHSLSTPDYLACERTAETKSEYYAGELVAMSGANLESLAEVLILAQDRAHAEHWVRQPDGHWLFEEAGSTGGVLRLESVGCELKLADAYHRVLDR